MRENLNAVANRLDFDEIERRKDLKRENEQIRRDAVDHFLNQTLRDNHDMNTKMTLKEKLNVQKLERLNQHIFNRTEEKRFGLTSIPFDEQARKKPH